MIIKDVMSRNIKVVHSNFLTAALILSTGLSYPFSLPSEASENENASEDQKPLVVDDEVRSNSQKILLSAVKEAKDIYPPNSTMAEFFTDNAILECTNRDSFSQIKADFDEVSDKVESTNMDIIGAELSRSIQDEKELIEARYSICQEINDYTFNTVPKFIDFETLVDKNETYYIGYSVNVENAAAAKERLESVESKVASRLLTYQDTLVSMAPRYSIRYYGFVDGPEDTYSYVGVFEDIFRDEDLESGTHWAREGNYYQYLALAKMLVWYEGQEPLLVEIPAKVGETEYLNAKTKEDTTGQGEQYEAVANFLMQNDKDKKWLFTTIKKMIDIREKRGVAAVVDSVTASNVERGRITSMISRKSVRSVAYSQYEAIMAEKQYAFDTVNYFYGSEFIGRSRMYSETKEGSVVRELYDAYYIIFGFDENATEYEILKAEETVEQTRMKSKLLLEAIMVKNERYMAELPEPFKAANGKRYDLPMLVSMMRSEDTRNEADSVFRQWKMKWYFKQLRRIDRIE